MLADSLPIVTAAALLVGASSAQGITFNHAGLAHLPIGPHAPNTSLRDAVTGHFTGMHLRDAVVLAETTPVLVTAPGVVRSAVRLPAPTSGETAFDRTDVRAIATVPNAGQGGLDALAAVSGAGLWLWSKAVDYDTGEADYVVQQLSAQPVWAGVKRLRVADVDNDGNADILGLQANDTTIRCLLRNSSGGTTQWNIATGGRVYDFLVADLIPGGAPELAVLNGVTTGAHAFGGGIRLFAPGASTPLQTIALPTTGGTLTTLPTATTPGLLAAGLLGGVHQLVAFGSSASGLVAGGTGSTVALPDRATAMTAGPWQDAPAISAIITLANTPNPVVLPHLGGLTFGAPTTIPLTSVPAPGEYENLATPVLADFHGDPAAPPERQGRPMLLYPMESLGAGIPGSIVMQYENTWLPGDVLFGAPGAESNEVRGMPTSGPAPTRLGMLAWQLDCSPSDAADRVVATSLLASGGVAMHAPGLLPYWSAQFDLPAISFDSAYALVLRFERVEDGQVIRWPARATLVAHDPSAVPSGNVGTLARLRATFQSIYGTQPGALLASQQVLVLQGGGAFFGIVGDVTQPPSGGDSRNDDDEPPAGAGG
ncbi:MAG: hypothetical protein JNK15_02625 [Planctomycetes bacterium]|nr:hypothetical protein [Planctomycetota bacterium]